MKKMMIAGTVLLGGLLSGVASGVTAHAADTTNGSTDIGAEVVRGDVTLTVNQSINFGSQPLAADVDFGSKDIGIYVIDFSGTTNGYTVSAKLTDTDAARILKVAGKELSEQSTEVVIRESNGIQNQDTVEAELSYNGLTELGTYSSTIEWNLIKATTSQIAE